MISTCSVTWYWGLSDLSLDPSLDEGAEGPTFPKGTMITGELSRASGLDWRDQAPECIRLSWLTKGKPVAEAEK